MGDSRTGVVVLTVVVTLGGLALAGLIFMYSGVYNVAATAGHTSLVSWVLETTQERSVGARAADVAEPPAADPAAISHGFEHFRAMCVDCHGAPGVDRGEPGQGLVPEPPELSEEAHEMTAGELFWITKHGIKMAGMPAFGPTHSDEEIWGIVAFLEELEGMSAEEYGAWEARYRESAGAGGGSGSAADSTATGGAEDDDGHSHGPGSEPHSH